MKTCKWTDGPVYALTECGHETLYLSEKHRYCPFCGGLIVTKDEPPEEETESVGPR